MTPGSSFSGVSNGNLQHHQSSAWKCNKHPMLKCGMILACYLPQYIEEEPQIGKISQVSDKQDDIEIEWMRGTYYEPLVVYKSRRGTTWKEHVSVHDILFPIELTASGRISTMLRSKLQVAYWKRRDIV